MMTRERMNNTTMLPNVSVFLRISRLRMDANLW